MNAKTLLLPLIAVSLGHAALGAHWPLETTADETFTLHGEASTVTGVKGKAVALDGRSLLTVKDSAAFGHGAAGFAFCVWVNPFAPGDGQQMLAGKSVYSQGQREWGVMLDQDGKLRLYVHQGGWKTVEHSALPKAGQWVQVGVVMRTGEAELWVNGALSGRLALREPVPRTAAPLTMGGIHDRTLRQTFFGALDEARAFDTALPAAEMAALFRPVTATLPIPKRKPAVAAPPANPFWSERGAVHAAEDRTSLIFDGQSPNKLACDTTLRAMPDGSWVMVMLGGGDREPVPANRVFLSRSRDEGRTWSAMEPVDLGVKAKNPSTALVPSELMVRGSRCTLFVATHNGKFGNWKEWMSHSDDSCRTWSALEPAPGRLGDRTFIRNHIVTRDGRILLPFQHYLDGPGPLNPRNGILVSADGGKTWTEHGNIRLSPDDTYRGWAENNIAELIDGRIAMIIRADRLGGVLYYAESNDGGVTWPEFATKTNIPNPGSKATLYGLGGDSVALLHNPNPAHRSPMALWISFDGMKTWPYQRVLVEKSSDGPRGRLNYPDGFVSADRKWLHFAFDDNRDRAVHVSARLPEIPMLWDKSRSLPASANLPVLEGVRFSVIKPYEFAKDGYRFLHGVGLCFHKGKLYASFGHNRGGENTDTEEARFCVSDDDGRTWSEVRAIDSGDGPVGVSHGAFLSHQGTLWAFMGAYTGTMQGIHTRAYVLDENSRTWQSKGTILEGGFWPMQEPIRMDDGNWIMAGISARAYTEKGTHPAAVAISRGEDFKQWDLVVIPPAPGLQMWGESTVIVKGKQVVNLSRYGAEGRALYSVSEDYGRTWSEMWPGDLPMATSKPIAGLLSTGQRYLVCTTTADSGKRRSPLTIAVSKPGEAVLSQVFVIRHAVSPDGPGESHEKAALSYPYAIEHDGKLYVGYSNSGDKSTRVGTGRELWNNNSAELAVIPIAALHLER